MPYTNPQYLALLTTLLLLLCAACAAAPTTPDNAAQKPVDPLEGFRLGRVGHAAKAWFILPEDDDNTRLCLNGEAAAPFQRLGARVKFDAEVGAPPADPKACTPIQLKRIASVPEGDLHPPKHASPEDDAPAASPDPQDDK